MGLYHVVYGDGYLTFFVSVVNVGGRWCEAVRAEGEQYGRRCGVVRGEGGHWEAVRSVGVKLGQKRAAVGVCSSSVTVFYVSHLLQGSLVSA